MRARCLGLVDDEGDWSLGVDGAGGAFCCDCFCFALGGDLVAFISLDGWDDAVCDRERAGFRVCGA